VIRSVLGSRASIGGVLGSGRGASGPPNGLLTNLIAYWALDEAGGANNALDKHSNGLTLTQVNSPGADTGKVYATARTFAGANTRFNRTSESLLQLGTSTAWAIWFYPNSGTPAATEYIATKTDGVTVDEMLIAILSTGKCYYRGKQSGSVQSTGTINGAAWNLAICWTDGTNQYISLNNATADSSGSGSATTNRNGALTIGAYVSGINTFTGRIGPVVFWKNRTLDATARAALWNGGAGLAYSAFTA